MNTLQKVYMSNFFVILFLFSIFLSLSCSVINNNTNTTNQQQEQTDFISSPFVNPMKVMTGETDINRIIEEADIIKVEGNQLYLLNRYKNLIIINIESKNNPVILSKLFLPGYPVEMYIRDKFAYIILNSNIYNYNDAMLMDSYYENSSSELVVVNMEDLNNPKIISDFKFNEIIGDTRIVGDILYAVSYLYQSTDDGKSNNYTSVVSFNLKDPGNIKKVEQKTFPGISNEIHVTLNTIFIALGEESDNNSIYQNSSIQLVDISDPLGQITLLGKISIAGVVSDRFKMDFYNNILRVVSYDFEKQESILHTIDVSDHQTPIYLGSLTIIKGERLFATKFDKNRVYIVTYFVKDPLWIIDLTDPKNPALLGQLEVPGWATYIEARDNQLIAIGVDDTDNLSRTYVAIYDVSDPVNPKQINRIIFGENYSWSGAYSDYKALKIIDELGLIALPLEIFEQNKQSYKTGVQLIEFDSSTLSQKGFINQDGSVNRIINNNGILYTISNTSLQAVSISDSRNPIVEKKIDLVKNITNFKINNGYGFQIVENLNTGDDFLEIVKLGSKENIKNTLNSIELPLKYGQILDDFSGPMIIFGNSKDSLNQMFILIDISNPLVPIIKGNILLPNNNYFSFSQSKDSLIYGSNIIKIGNTLAVRSIIYNNLDSKSIKKFSKLNKIADTDYKDGILLFDISDYQHPSIGKTIDYFQKEFNSMQKADNKLYVTYNVDAGTNTDGKNKVKYYIDMIDISNAQNPIISSSVNIPGIFLTQKNNMIFTLERTIDYDSGKYLFNSVIHSLQLEKNHAVLKNSLSAKKMFNDVVSFENNLYLTFKEQNKIGMTIVSLSNPLNLQNIFEIEMAKYVSILSLEQNLLFVKSSLENSVTVYNLKNEPNTLNPWDNILFPNYPFEISVDENNVYSPLDFYGVFFYSLKK